MAEIMFNYNIRTAVRNVLRFKSHTVFSISGLTISLACVFVITAWAIQELRYDRFHNHAERIYMVTTQMKDNSGNIVTFPETSTILAQELKKSIPAIQQSCHFMYMYTKRLLQNGNYGFEETGIAADSKMLSVLSFPLVEGSINFLDDPGTIFITEKLSKKLFPGETATGKVVMYSKEKALTVRGIIRDIPENSSLTFDFIVPYQIEMGNNPEWWPVSDATFIRLDSKNDIAKTKQMACAIWRENVANKQYDINFIPVTRLRYGADFYVFNAKHGNYLKLYSFIGIALLILMLASLNYTNLISSYSIKRAREVGIRKINGATPGNMFKYFLTESVINSIIASSLAIALSVVFIHLFQRILDINLESRYLMIGYISGTIGSLVIVGIISGLYPSIITSSLSLFPKSQGDNSSYHKNILRHAFILSQFIISITLTIVCLVIIRQTNYLNKFDVGYDPHNIIKMYMQPEGIKDSESIKNSLVSEPGIEHVSFANASPVNLSSFFATGNWKWEGLKEGSSGSIYRLLVDHAYLDVFHIPLLRGRGFSALSDKDKVIINEKLAKLLGFDDPVGKILSQGENKYEIIGVVKDFHFQNLSNGIQPLLFMYSNKENRMFIKTGPNVAQGIGASKKLFARFYDQPFEYDFVEDDLKSLYVNENKISLGIIVFTILAIILSCIGLIGQITFNTESKTKEIGVRKVCGAKITEIVFLLNRDIIKWFLVGSLAGSMISWIIITRWLENFAFRISLNYWIFILGASIILLIAALTISWQTWKAATKNPVEALKYE